MNKNNNDDRTTVHSFYDTEYARTLRVRGYLLFAASFVLLVVAKTQASVLLGILSGIGVFTSAHLMDQGGAGRRGGGGAIGSGDGGSGDDGGGDGGGE